MGRTDPLLEHLDALHALAETGTVTAAATRLRLTQGAVSKRLAQLEEQVGRPLLQRQGRRVHLTPHAQEIVERTRPLVAELRAALHGSSDPDTLSSRLVIGVSESILASWGPAILARTAAELPGLTLELATHRSPVAIDRVRSGEYQLALVAGSGEQDRDLAAVPVIDESMVIVPSGLGKLRIPRHRPLEVISIEEASATWRSLRRQRPAVTVVRQLQSFAPVVQLARAGFGHGLAPLGIVRALGVPRKSWRPARLARPITLVGRSTTLRRSDIAEFCRTLIRHAGRLTLR